MSAEECRTSPARGGPKPGFAERPRARAMLAIVSSSVIRAPVPMLMTSPASGRGVAAASRFAWTMSSI
jgi:hypothetical protein